MNFKKTWKTIASVAIAGWICLPNANPVQAQDSTRQLQSAVTKMNDWLAGSQHGPRWREILELGSLDTVSGLGPKGDLADLVRVREKFFQNRFSAVSPNFDTVRRALDLHIQNIAAADQLIQKDGLTETSIDKWKASFQEVSKSFRLMTSDELNKLRSEALLEAKLLRKYVKLRGKIHFDPTKDPIRSFLSKHPEAKGFTVEHSPNHYELNFGVVDQLIAVLEKPVHLSWDKKNTHFKISDSGTQTPSVVDPAKLYTELRDVQKTFQVYSRLDPTSYSLHVATVVDQYSKALNLGRRKNLPSALKRSVDRMVKSLDEWKTGGSRAAQGRIAGAIGYLEAANQCPGLVMAFKRTFWRPSAKVFVSERLANRFATRPVSNRRAVNERILDNQVYGVAQTNGTVSVDFVPNSKQATIKLKLSGNVHSDNYSPVGPISVYTGSNGQVEAARNIQLNFGGWYHQNPYAAVNLQSYFKGTSCGLLISRLAESQFQKQKSAAEAEGAMKTEAKILREFTDQTNQAFSEGRAKARESRAKLAPLMPYRPSVFLLTDQQFLRIYGSKASGSQIPPLFDAPQINTPCDVAIQLHHSMLTNLLEDHFSGFAIDSKQLETLAPAPKDGKKREPFSLVLERTRPIDFRFVDQLIEVSVFIDRFTAKGQTLRDSKVTVRFKFTFDNEGQPGIRLQQIGRVRAELADPDDVSVMSATVLEVIETTVNQQLAAGRPQGSKKGIKLPMNLLPLGKIPALAELPNSRELLTSNLVISSFKDGWAEFAWRLNDMPAGTHYPTRIQAIATEKQFQEKEIQLNKAMEGEQPSS